MTSLYASSSIALRTTVGFVVQSTGFSRSTAPRSPVSATIVDIARSCSRLDVTDVSFQSYQGEAESSKLWCLGKPSAEIHGCADPVAHRKSRPVAPARRCGLHP